MRRGFNLLMAIFVLLLFSGAAVLTLKYASISSKHIADSYLKEQAEIFLQSAIEAAILKIEGRERNVSGCVKDLNFTSSDDRFKAYINIEKYYLYNGLDNDGNSYCSSDIVDAISTEESHGYVIIDAVVETNKDNNKIKDTTPVRVTRRVLQRP